MRVSRDAIDARAGLCKTELTKAVRGEGHGLHSLKPQLIPQQLAILNKFRLEL